MKKQFLRVKQIADQKFQREKSSVLSSELNAVEKRVDLIKESCYATGKKLSACVHRLCPDEKSPKKIPEAALSQCMEEWGFSLGENSILGLTLVDYAHIEETLANDLHNFTLLVREQVVEPLQNILNTDVSNILKYRKQLSKLTSEMDSAKARYQSAWRSSLQATGNNVASAVAKAHLLREEAEDIANRAEQCRDSLSAEMFNLVSREPEMSLLFVKLCQLQLDYHRKAFYTLESALPEIEAQIKSCPHQPVFGVSLEEHLRVTKREIAVVLETCICWLLESAMEEEGLFRIGGSMTKIKKIKSAFDACLQYLIADEKDPHNIAGALKLYLRSLPEPLLTYELYDQWMEAAVEPDHDSRLKLMWNVIHSLPESHFRNLRYLIKFLSKLCGSSDVNKMSIQNIAIVIGPNLIWPPTKDSVLGTNMAATNLHSSIVDTLITYADWFFPGDCEFFTSHPTTLPSHIEGLPSPSSVPLGHPTLNGNDSALDSRSTSSNSPTSPSPKVYPRKRAAPKAPHSARTQITRSVSCSGFQANVSSKSNLSEGSRITNLSVSHENLLNHSDDASAKANQKKSHMSEDMPSSPAAKPKPPRQIRTISAPVRFSPVVERKPLERPSFPPPERPFSKSESEQQHMEPSSTFDFMRTPPDSPIQNDVFADDPIELEDISLSFESSDSESYNECQMFLANNDNSSVKQISCNETEQKEKSDVEDNMLHAHLSEMTDEKVVPNDSLLTGGTPTWFDHYGEDKLQSLWFANSDCEKKTEVENFRTVIEGGNSRKALLDKSSVADNSMKLRNNSETHNTRL